MKLKHLSSALLGCIALSGCSGLVPAERITGSFYLSEKETSLNNAIVLISMHADENTAHRSLITLKSCGLGKGDLMTVKHLYRIKYEHSQLFNKCWDNIISYMKNGDPRVKKGGINYPLAQTFLKDWEHSQL